MDLQDVFGFMVNSNEAKATAACKEENQSKN